MKCSIRETDHAFEYHIEEAPAEFDHVLEHFFFEKRGGIHRKIYQKESLMFDHDRGVLIRNFRKYLPQMIKHFLEQEPLDWESALQETTETLCRHGIRWWLAGSAACSVRGIDIAPHDIDIMTYLSEVPKFRDAFARHRVEPFHHVSDWMVKGFGVIYLNGRVDIAFDPEESSDVNGILDYGVYASQHLEEISWYGYRIMVPPVELHITGNENRGRKKRVELIKAYIRRNE